MLSHIFKTLFRCSVSHQQLSLYKVFCVQYSICRKKQQTPKFERFYLFKGISMGPCKQHLGFSSN